jgi:hypothetical protein
MVMTLSLLVRMSVDSTPCEQPTVKPSAQETANTEKRK